MNELELEYVAHRPDVTKNVFAEAIPCNEPIYEMNLNARLP